jgi:O-antigen/teichoic acid export membrane protein
MKIREVYNYAGTLYAVNLIASFITFVVMIVLSREVSKADMGAYGLFQAYFLLAVSASGGFSISRTIVKYVAERKVPLSQIHTLIGLWVGGMLLLALLVGSLLLGAGYELLGLAVLALPAYHLMDVALAYARGHLWKHVEWLILLGSSIATSVFILILLQPFDDYHGAVYGQIASLYAAAFSLLTLFLFQRHRGAFAAIEGAWVKGFGKVAIPLFVTSVIASVGETADRLIIERLLGLAILGEYFLAMAFMNIVDRPVAMLSRVMLSYFSDHNRRASGPDSHTHLVTGIVKVNLFLLPMFALTVVALLPWIMQHFLNKDYSSAFTIFAVVSIVSVIKAVEVVNSTLVIAKDNTMTNLYSQAVSLVIYLPVAIVLARAFGIVGVAAAVVVRWGVYAGYQFIHMRKKGVDTVSVWLLARALVAYGLAVSLFHTAPLAMPFVYLAFAGLLQLWSFSELSSAVPAPVGRLLRLRAK